MVPSFNFYKIQGYTFIAINSLNSFDIISRIKTKIKTKLDVLEKEKTQNPIVISILISQSSITIDYILQYEYILDKIKRWCQIELKITKPIHTLIIMSMEHKYENLKINQSTEWPLIYLDTCYDDTIKNKNGLPISLEQIVFSPFKKLVDDEIIDLEELIKLSRKMIYPCYKEYEKELIDKIIFNDEKNYKSYILQPIKRLITELNQEENCTILENLSENIDDLWSFKKITNLSSPPSSALKYLSQNLVNAVGNIMGIIFEILFSGIDKHSIDEIDKIKLEDSSIFDYMMNRKEFNSKFHCIFNSDMTLSCTIEKRYSYDIDTFIPGQLAFYKYIWEIASNIYDNESKLNDNDFSEKLRKEISFYDDNFSLKSAFDDLMNSILSLNDDYRSSSYPFIAAYLLVTVRSVRVDIKNICKFDFWISSFIKILKGFFYKKDKLTVQFIMYHLISNKALSKFARDFTMIYMFFPFPIYHSRELFITQKREFYKNLIFDKVKDSIEDLPGIKHINTEAAYLFSRVISKNFISTINNLDIKIDEANELFQNEFETLSSIYNYLKNCGEFINDFNFFKEPRYYLFLKTIQKFFIQYGDIILYENQTEMKVIFNIKIDSYSNFSEIKEAQNLIINFVKDQINKLNLKRRINPDDASYSLIMYYFDLIYKNNSGLIDIPINYNLNEEVEEEEEEEEEAEEEDMKQRNFQR